MRRLALTNKKLRGVRRRLRSLATWAQSFAGNFPEGITQADRYCNFKIPVHQAMVEGKQATQEIRRQCAQQVVQACSILIQSKPESSAATWVIASLCLPDMFTSEVCIYTDPQYLLSKTAESASSYGATTQISGRSLAQEWGLVLPHGMRELGMLDDYRGYPDKADWHAGERWFYGELV